MAQSVACNTDSTRRATYQDVLDAPAHLVAEIIDGTLHTHPRPASRHARASSVLDRKIGVPFDNDPDDPGGWWIIFEPELHFAEEIVVPDLAGWRRERMPEYPDTAYFTLAPDWVCEVLPASTRKVDLHEKRPIYALAGVPHLWLVDPTDRTLEAFELRDGEGRRSREHPPIRRDHLQPQRSVALRGCVTAACTTVDPRESRGRALWSTSHGSSSGDNRACRQDFRAGGRVSQYSRSDSRKGSTTRRSDVLT